MNTKHILFLLLLIGSSVLVLAQERVFTAHDIFKIDLVADAKISPDGQKIAYVLYHQKAVKEGKGGGTRELFVKDVASGKVTPYITGKNSFYGLGWTPDSKNLMFRGHLGDVKGTQVFMMPIDGGMYYPVTDVATSVQASALSPDGKMIAYVTTPKGDSRSSELTKMGFDAEIFEEDIQQRQLHLYNLESKEDQLVEIDGSVFGMGWSPNSKMLALQIAPNNLVDDSYMLKRLHTYDVASKKLSKLVDNPGKLTAMSWSPDNKHLAFVSANDISDPVSGCLFVADVPNSKKFTELKNYSKGFEGSVTSVSWLDNENVLFTADESVNTTLSKLNINKGKRELVIEGGKLVFNHIERVGDLVAIVGNTAAHPGELFTFDMKSKKMTRHTNSNEWLNDIKFGKQEKISYEARDGLRIDGVLIYPANYQEGTTYPLICHVHGGPESCIKNGWYNYYSTWGQVAAGRDFFVFMPNYRASSGRGVEFEKMDQKDLGAAEFDDVLDGIDFLVKEGKVDRARVGIGGGSYGGYFSAWAATKHSEHFAASVAFVGISNQISKRNTTDIPLEDYHVHWNIWTNDDPMLIYDRSPVKYVRNNQTPTLILHGKKDPRVHPSQSLELYRQLKLHGKAPVRLVWYPGEGHGNRNNPARLDYCLRTMAWFDYYLKGNNDKTQKPPMEIEYELDKLDD